MKRAPRYERLWAVVIGAALWGGGLAAPAHAVGQVIIFRDPVLTKRYTALEARLTLLQVQAEADKLQAKMRGQKVVCRGIVVEVFPPQVGYDPDACIVQVALQSVSGFTAPELPVLSYVVSRAKAIMIRRNASLLITGKLYAIDRNGAVAVELDAPAGWRDPLVESSAGGR